MPYTTSTRAAHRRHGRQLAPALTIGLVLAGASPGTAQEPDISAVRQVTQNYLDGLLHADTALLADVFQPGTRFFGVPGRALDVWTVEEWIASRAGKRLDPTEYRHRVVAVDVAGDAASAKVDLDWPGMHFVDYLSLLRIGGEWKIVGKIWHQEPSARVMAGIDKQPLSRREAERYVGRYATPDRQFEIVFQEAGLRLLLGVREYRLFHQGDGVFAPEWDPRDRLRFIVEDGSASSIAIRQGDVDVTATRMR